jgi:peptide/nickel transport system permease protein
VILGAQLSLSIAIAVIALALLIGVPLGLFAGYQGGHGGMFIMRVADVFLSIPPLVLALAAAAALSPSLWASMVAISLAWWPWYTRLVYAEVLRVKQELFVEASRAMGTPRWRIVVMDVFPHAFPPVVVKASLDLGFVILLAASLSFLGLGAQPPAPDWGTMVAQARTYLPANWWGVTFPGMAIALAVLAFNLLGDALRDLFDVEIERERWIG